MNSPCYSRLRVKLGPQDLKSLPNFLFFNAAEIYLKRPDLIKHDDNNNNNKNNNILLLLLLLLSLSLLLLLLLIIIIIIIIINYNGRSG